MRKFSWRTRGEEKTVQWGAAREETNNLDLGKEEEYPRRVELTSASKKNKVFKTKPETSKQLKNIIKTRLRGNIPEYLKPKRQKDENDPKSRKRTRRKTILNFNLRKVA